MRKSPILKQRSRKARGLDACWPVWLQMARELPDIRIEKVQGMRKAIAASNVDNPDVIDETINRLGADLGIDWLSEPPDSTDPPAKP